jgi:hypothetical protein
MLFYTIVLTFINVLVFLLSIPAILAAFRTGNFGTILSAVVIIIAVLLDIVIFFTILLFFKFHLELIFNNQTTLETLELKRMGKNPE